MVHQLFHDLESAYLISYSAAMEACLEAEVEVRVGVHETSEGTGRCLTVQKRYLWDSSLVEGAVLVNPNVLSKQAHKLVGAVTHQRCEDSVVVAQQLASVEYVYSLVPTEMRLDELL